MRRAILALLLLSLVVPPPAGAQEAIRFGPSRLENHFPDELTFEVTVESSAGEIASAHLYYRVRNALSTNQVPLQFVPAERVTLRYTWDTSRATVPPSTPLYFYWEATDSAGNRVTSEEVLCYYDDVRYDWQTLENESISVWWHDRPAGFGDQVFEIAVRAVDEQRGLFQAEVEYPMRVIIYNDAEEFAGWHLYVDEFIGGQAFPSMGITTQIVSAYGSQERWLNGVVPHEIAHLYFYQVTDHPLSSPPRWLNEGVAQYAEFGDHGPDLDLAEREILSGALIPLRTITGGFGHDESRVRLAYAESLSAVTYLVQAYGAQGLGDLMAAYGEGQSGDRAFETALGRTMDEFEADWLTWLGVPEGTYVVATRSWPTLVPLQLPTMRPRPALATDTSAPVTSTPTRAPTVSREPTGTPTPSPAPGPEPPEEPGFRTGRHLCSTVALPGACLLLGLLSLAGFRWLRSRRT